MQAALIYLLAITGAEIVTVIVHPLWGVAFHIFILMATIAHSAVASRLPGHNWQLILSLALLPLVRVVSLSMPLIDIPQILWFPIVYAPLIAAAMVVVRILGYRPEHIGFRLGFPRTQLAVGLTGVAFGVMEYLILKPESLAAEPSLQQVWPWALIFLFFVGFGEELIFRGVLQRAAVEAFGGKRGIVYVSFLFAILHMGYLSWLDLVFVFAVALFLGWVVKKTGSLLGVSLSHGITNTVLYAIAPFFF